MTIKKITLAVFLAASCNLGWQFYRMHRESVASQILYEQHGISVCQFGPSTDEIARLYIELFLLLAVVGSRFPGLTNTLLTVTGLSGATIIYMHWWQVLIEVSYAEITVELLPHFVYLLGGNALDFGIALSVAALIVLNVRDAAYSLVYGPTCQSASSTRC